MEFRAPATLASSLFADPWEKGVVAITVNGVQANSSSRSKTKHDMRVHAPTHREEGLSAFGLCTASPSAACVVCALPCISRSWILVYVDCAGRRHAPFRMRRLMLLSVSAQQAHEQDGRVKTHHNMSTA
jgi:hypothetical protein